MIHGQRCPSCASLQILTTTVPAPSTRRHARTPHTHTLKTPSLPMSLLLPWMHPPPHPRPPHRLDPALSRHATITHIWERGVCAAPSNDRL